MIFSFAIPLIYFHGYTGIFQALKTSLLVYYHNMAALGVYVAVIAGLILVSIPFSLIPLIIIMPLSYLSFFVAFQSIFVLPYLHTIE